jgi:hypothetical protein
MWEMIQNMASDRLWIYTGIVGSLFGAAFLFWFKDTRMAMWAVRKFDASCECLATKWGWTWLQDDPNAWRTKYPKITSKIDELEARIEKLEKSSNKPTIDVGNYQDG